MGTPRRSLDNDDNLLYSPVSVRESPVKGIHQKGNLTGNVRLVRDLSCDMYNLIQDWNVQHLVGCQLLTNIADKKISAMADADIDSTLQIYPTGLQSLCDELERICLKLESLVGSMKLISSQIEAIIQLETRQIVNQSPLFLTWPARKFGDTFNDITDLYQKELKVKYSVKEDVAHCKNKESLMVYLATWMYQPFLSCDLLVESLLLETGLR